MSRSEPMAPAEPLLLENRPGPGTVLASDKTKHSKDDRNKDTVPSKNPYESLTSHSTFALPNRVIAQGNQ